MNAISIKNKGPKRPDLRHVQFTMFFRYRRHRVVHDIVSTSVPCHTSFTSSTSRCLRYRVYIVSTSVPCHRWPVIPCLHRSHRRHRDVDDIVSTSCRHWYPVIPRLHRLHRRHRDVDDIVSILHVYTSVPCHNSLTSFS